MQSNTLKALITVSVLSFGFISCSKDKENTVVYKQDEFKPDRISTENEDKSIFQDGDITTLEAGGKLKFDSLGNHNFTKDPILFHIESTCRQNNNPSLLVTVTDFENQKQVDVAQILPSGVFASTVEDTATCDFTITTHNALGSTNINKLYNIEITNLLKFSNFDLDIVGNDRINLEVSRDEAIAVDGKGSVQLVCQDFTRLQTLVSEQFSLAGFNLEQPEILGQIKNSGQNCRLVFEGRNTPRVSKFFTLDFPVSALAVKGIVEKLQIVNNLKNQKMITFRVINPNAFPVKFQIHAAQSMRAVVRPLYMSGAYPFIGRMQRTIVDLAAKAEDATRINNDLFFTVNGGETVEVTGTATRALICQNDAPTVPRTPWASTHPFSPPMPIYLFAGYNYDFETNPQFLYDAGNSSWEEVDVNMVGTARKTDISDYPYWVWPTNDQIHAAFGSIVGIWENLREFSDVCTD